MNNVICSITQFIGWTIRLQTRAYSETNHRSLALWKLPTLFGSSHKTHLIRILPLNLPIKAFPIWLKNTRTSWLAKHIECLRFFCLFTKRKFFENFGQVSVYILVNFDNILGELFVCLGPVLQQGLSDSLCVSIRWWENNWFFKK